MPTCFRYVYTDSTPKSTTAPPIIACQTKPNEWSSTTPLSEAGDASTTLIGPTAGTFEGLFNDPSKATFIEHGGGGDMDTMAPQFSDTMMDIDSPHSDAYVCECLVACGIRSSVILTLVCV